jgi:ABC-type molybdate transport system substrate-binding protein
VPIPAAQNARTNYPIALLSQAKPRALSEAFVSFVRSSFGQAVLRAAGFGPP